jgi:hypothetical protein
VFCCDGQFVKHVQEGTQRFCVHLEQRHIQVRSQGKKKGVTWVIQATTSQRNPGCTEKRILVQDQDGGNAQHGKDRTQHHRHLQKGLSERRGPRAMLHTRKACHTDRRASTSHGGGGGR